MHLGRWREEQQTLLGVPFSRPCKSWVRLSFSACRIKWEKGLGEKTHRIKLEGRKVPVFQFLPLKTSMKFIGLLSTALAGVLLLMMPVANARPITLTIQTDKS